MAWNYNPTSKTPIVHKAGEIPPRPLSVGDQILWDSGYSDFIIATTDKLLRCYNRPVGIIFREPIEGNDSNCIFSTGDREDAS